MVDHSHELETLREGRRRPSIRIVMVCALLSAGCSTAPVRYDYSKEPDPRLGEYIIGAADRLSVQVWKNPDLSRDVTVRPDGTITLPLIGDLMADGKTTNELKDDIAKRVAKFVRDDAAVVTLAVTAVNSYSFTVSGNVEHAGLFSSPKYVTVLEAVQLAGGPNRFASPKETKLIRRSRGSKLRIIPINYPAVLNGTQPEANLPLIAGDQIYVP